MNVQKIDMSLPANDLVLLGNKQNDFIKRLYGPLKPNDLANNKQQAMTKNLAHLNNA